MATITGSKRLLSISTDSTAATTTMTLGGVGVATEGYVTTQISNLVDSAPGTLNTLNELAAALGDDASFSTTVSTALGNRLRIDTNAQGLNSTQKANGRTNLGLGTLATLSTVNAATITNNSVGAAELNVTSNGSNGQVLTSDGDGTFSWTSKTTNTDTITSVGISGSETAGTVTLTGAGATTITQSGGAIEIRSTDTNTTYSVGDGGLTQKNFTSTLKTKLDGIAASANNYSLPAGSSAVRGGFKIGYTENGKNYPVEVSSEKMYVNVPWTDTNTTYTVGDGGLTQKNFTSTLKTKLDGIATNANNYSLPEATATARGGIELFSNTDQTVAANSISTTAGRTYGIQLNSAGQAVVNVPWTDNNTTYTVGDGGLTEKNFTSALKTKLDGIAASANNYSHPTHPGDDFSVDTGALSGFNVVSDIDINVTTDTLGHVTDANGSVSTRQLANLRIPDTRAAEISPNDYLDNALSLDFTDDFGSLGAWYSGITLKGWSDNYTAWQLISNAASNTNDQNLYFRSGVGTTWGTMHKVYHSGNLTAGTNVSISASGVISSTDTNTTYTVGDGGLTQKNFTTTLKNKLDGIAASANNYSLPAGSSSTRGGFKIGYTESGKNYPVEVSSEKMYVNVPWTDSNTNYYLNGITKSGNTLTFAISGATNQTYTFGSNAFNSTSYSTASGVEDNADVTDTANVVAALTAGTNVQIAANGTISATDTDTVYVHPTTAGNKHIPTGGAAGQFLKYSSSGTAVWATPSYTTNTNTQLSNEQVQDIVGAMFSGNTETNITATYQDGDGTIDLSVAANYGSWDLMDENDVVSRVDSGEHVKFQGANISGTGTSSDPFLVATPDTNTTYTADGNYGMTLSGTAFRLENDRRRNSSTQDIHTGNTHDYTFYDADVGIRWYTAGAEEMRLEDDGDLHVDGDVIAFSTTVSDARLKDDVQTIENATEKVNQLRGVSYTWNEGSRKGQREIGVIAQEVQEVVPEVVHEKKLPFVGDGTYKTVDYEKLVALLIESNKELTARVEQLEARLYGTTK